MALGKCLSGWLVAGAALLQVGAAVAAEPYADRFVWVFGWSLGQDADVAEIAEVLQRAGRSGYNGAVISCGLDALCKRSEDYFRRLGQVQAACEQNHLELIPAVFSIGYGGGILSHNRHLAEGLPVRDALLVVTGTEARLVADPAVEIRNGGFEEFRGQRFVGWQFHDQPGEVSFVDTEVVHSGRAALRMENFQANAHGHGRIMQEVAVHPYRCYKLTLWVKTEGLEPVSAFMVQVLAQNRALAPVEFPLRSTSDWTKLVLIFNSQQHERVRVYAGTWGGRAGRFWIDDWTIDEMGPINVLRRPGAPITVKSETGGTPYEEGRDYWPLEDPRYSPYHVDRPAPTLRLAPGSRIRDGERLRVSWYHSQKIYDSQVTVCMAEPELEQIFDHEAALLARHLRPKKVLLNMDEVRMGGTCAACQGQNMAELLGRCITNQVEALRKHNPGIEVYIWSDMLDPHHNARKDYYLVAGDFTGSWRHVPKDLTVAVWGGAARPESLRFFAQEGFSTLVACYYDADDLSDVRAWQQVAAELPRVRGFMYTTWQKRYDLLESFGKLLFPAHPTEP